MISEFLRVGFHPRPGDTRETWLSWANWLHNLGIDPITVPVDGWVLRLPPTRSPTSRTGRPARTSTSTRTA